jgi:hypothetical protein
MIMRSLELNWILQFRNLQLAQESNPSIEGLRNGVPAWFAHVNLMQRKLAETDQSNI